MMGFLVSLLVFAYTVGLLSLIVFQKTLSQQARPFCLPMAKKLSFLLFMFIYVYNLIFII